MVKRRSSLASNEVFRVRFPAGAMQSGHSHGRLAQKEERRYDVPEVAGSIPASPTHANTLWKGYRTGDGTRLESGRAMSLAGSTPAPSAVSYRAAGSETEQVEIFSRSRFRWDLLADAAKGAEVWKAIARQMGPQALRMNLNTLKRHGVLEDPEMVRRVAGRIADAEEIRRSRQYPYQYLAAYLNADAEVPQAIKGALGQAAEVACGGVPEMPGPVVIGLDVSGSMGMPVTGARGKGATSKMRCVDVAALFAAAVLRRNPDSVLVPFDNVTHKAELDPGDTILSLAERLARFGGGGTDCSLPLRAANTTFRDRKFAGCVLVSDNESWIGYGAYGSTGVMTEWQAFVKNQVRL